MDNLKIETSVVDFVPKSVKDKYPCLKRYTDEFNKVDFIVLFTGVKTGVCVHVFNQGSSCRKVGDFETKWCENDFKDFYGEVIISGK